MRRTPCAVLFIVVALMSLSLAVGTKRVVAQPDIEIMWINHLDLLPGDPSVITSFNAVNSGVGGGLAGLVVESTTIGEEAEGGGNKVVWTGLQVPPGYLVTGVRVCYESTSQDTYISQIRLAQVQDPPDAALVLLDDDTDLIDTGPICVDSAPPFDDTIDPSLGAVLLSLRVYFGDLSDSIVIRGVGLYLEAIYDPKEALEDHSHEYLTGRGVGHNKKVVLTGPVVMPAGPEAVPWRTNKKNK
jgi:hypothetical protein